VDTRLVRHAEMHWESFFEMANKNRILTDSLNVAYEAPPAEKQIMLWLVGWTSVLWLVNRFECVSEMSCPLP